MALELSKNKTVNFLVFTSIVGLFITALTLWYAADQKSSINGPSLLTSSQKLGVVFSLDKRLYYTDAEANLKTVISYKDLGLQTPLADIAFGEEALYVIEGRQHRIKKCSLSLETCVSIANIPGLMTAIAMDIAITPDNKYIYVSNSSLHRIDKFTIKGEYLYRLKVMDGLAFPNDIVAITNNTIVVADTNNHRVIAISDTPEHRGEIVWQLDVKKTLNILDFVWPTALQFTSNGRLWVNNQDGFFEKGEIVVYDALDYSFIDYQSNPGDSTVSVDFESQIVTLTENAEPKNLAPVKNSMLIANFAPIELIESDELTLGTRSFVDSLLASEFMTLSNDRQKWNTLVTVSQWGIGLFVFLLLYGGFLEIKEIKKREDEENTNPEQIVSVDTKLDPYLIEPDENGIVWLQINSDSLRPMKIILYFVLFAQIISIINYVVNGSDWFSITFLLLPIFAGGMIITFLIILSRVRLGRDGERIYISNGFGKQAYALFEDAYFSGNRIIIDNIAIPVQDTNGNTVYDKKEFDTYIKPLLELLQEKSEIQFLVDNLKRGDLLTWLGLIVGIPLFLAVFYFGLQY